MSISDIECQIRDLEAERRRIVIWPFVTMIVVGALTLLFGIGFPLLVLGIIFTAINNNKKNAIDKQIRDLRAKQCSNAPSSQNNHISRESYDKIMEARGLYESGHLSADEYKAYRDKILAEEGID